MHQEPVLLLRTSGAVTTALSPCYRSYLSLLRRELAGVARLHVLTDLSLSLPAGLTSRELRSRAIAHEVQLTRQLDGVPAFAYTVADVIDTFPHVAWPIPGNLHPLSALHNDTRLWVQERLTALRARGLPLTRTLERGQTVSNLISYYVHEPSLCLWMRRQQQQQRLQQRERVAGVARTDGSPSLPTHVWVIEDDAVFLGNIRRALAPYVNKTAADLVAVFQPSAYLDDQWHLHRNVAFAAALPDSLDGTGGSSNGDDGGGRRLGSTRLPLHKWEHVERYSVALLNKLGDLLHRGAAAYGEHFASTVCDRLSWCATADLRDERLVPRDASLYADSVPLARKTLASHLRRATVRSGAPGRWLHAVKGGCDMLAVSRCGVRLRREEEGGDGQDRQPCKALASKPGRSASTTTTRVSKM